MIVRAVRRLAPAGTAVALVAMLAGPAAGAVPTASPGSPVLSFLTQPSGSATGGVPFTAQPLVLDVDAGSVPRAGDPVVLSIVPGTGTPEANLACDVNPVLTDVTGRANFSGCRIDKAGSDYRLLAQVDRVAGQNATSTTIVVAVGPPVALSFTVAPTFASIAHPFDLAIAIADAGGNPVPSAAGTITVDIDPDTIEAATLNCPGGTSHVTTAGVATFPACTLDEPAASGEDVILRATLSNPSGTPALDPAQSGPISLQDATEAELDALTLTRSTSSVTFGQAVTFTAQFAGGAGKPMDLQRSDDDGETWFPIASLTANAAGTATFSYKPRTTGNYRLVYEGPPLSAAGRSDDLTVTVKELATLSPVQTKAKVIRAGTRVTFTTTARPIGEDLPRVLIEFQVYRLVNGTWQLSSTRLVRAHTDGRATLTWTFGVRGDWYVRAKVRGTQTEVAQPGRTADSVPTAVSRYRVA